MCASNRNAQEVERGEDLMLKVYLPGVNEKRAMISRVLHTPGGEE